MHIIYIVDIFILETVKVQGHCLEVYPQDRSQLARVVTTFYSLNMTTIRDLQKLRTQTIKC